jgi:RNase P/RNase MRP subunit p30
MRRFIDLHLKPSTQEQALEMASLATQLGYKQVAMTKPLNNHSGSIMIATRIDIEARLGRELQDVLKRNWKKYDIIAVRCLSKDVARKAAKDNRVDILLFPEDPDQRKKNWLDHHEAALLAGEDHAYEINASELLTTKPSHLSKTISQIKRDLVVASRHEIPVVLSSGASTPIMMREPKALIALATLLDIEESYATDMTSTIPEIILQRKKAKTEAKS